jgi:hypothetical protein
MAMPFERIEKPFVELRDFVLNDLDRLTSQEIGGNYLAAALIMCAHEAIADLRDGRPLGELPFADSLPPKWRAVAPSLYGALRDGLVHGYEAKWIRVDARRIELGVA